MPKDYEPGMGKPKGSANGKRSKYASGTAGAVVADVSLSSDSSPDTVAAINAVLDAGDAIMFSRTSGGGILCIAVYSKGCDPAKFYAKDADSAQVTLADIENAARG